MSIIFGIRKAEGEAVEDRQMLAFASATNRYAPDGTFTRTKERVGMGFQPYHTHERSNLESQPVIDKRGNMLTFDGRLDNHRDLCELLGIQEATASDSSIVLAAFERWSEDCFSRLVGDWALALWVLSERTLYLARDHAGTRSLYFQRSNGSILWSTFLETFFAGEQSYSLDETFAACYLSGRPTRDLTPYEGVRAVPPAHYLKFRDDMVIRKAHWRWLVRAPTFYKTDSRYEEHFLHLFRQSVLRRTGPGAPILAQLSGGMDSASIVCMSDHSRRSQDPDASLLDTVSYYNDSEPHWNERPYFSIVESRRGKIGTHIEGSFMDRTFEPHDPSQGVYLLPGADSFTIEQEHKLHAANHRRDFRVVLSGTGGDEITGGVPTALPELADLLASRDIRALLKRAIEWCLVDRSPLFQMLLNTCKYSFLTHLTPHGNVTTIPPWIGPRLRNRCAEAARHDLAQSPRAGLSHHSIDNGAAWWSAMELLPHLSPKLLSRPEYRYPYLDRDLVDYMFSIPRTQVLQPGRRRSLMRRALRGIVPPEILERRRKAYQIRGPLSAIQHAQDKLGILFSEALIGAYGFVNLHQLDNALRLTAEGNTTEWWQGLFRAVAYELWLKSMVIDAKHSTSSMCTGTLLPKALRADKIRVSHAAR